ncbi:MAG: hypothetical protein HY055_12660 [Magnetospirillum sp.]|nr:hypothetical protein [Magnetospirillum sp.]
METEIVDKGRFAQLIGRSPGRVSQLIAAGALDAALVDATGKVVPRSDRKAKVHVVTARRLLGLILHPGQQMAQERPILPQAAPPPNPPSGPTLSLPVSEAEETALRYQRAKAEKAEQDAAKGRAEARTREGHWVVASEASAAFARRLKEFIGRVDGALPTLAEHLAQELSVDAREATVLLRAWWRTMRKGEADDAREEADRHDVSLPEPDEDGAAAP